MTKPTALLTLLFVAVTIASPAIGQQSPSQQTPQTQAQPAPCGTTATQAASAPSTNTIQVNPNSKAAQTLGGALGKLQQYSPIDIAGTARNLQQRAKNKPGPCDPQLTQTASAAKGQSAPPKMPPDTVVALKCNPMAPASRDGHPGALILPDPQNFAVPRATDFLADSVTADLSAHTPCFLIRTDPATKKVFVLAQ